jgi:hypothetical protein
MPWVFIGCLDLRGKINPSDFQTPKSLDLSRAIKTFVAAEAERSKEAKKKESIKTM